MNVDTRDIMLAIGATGPITEETPCWKCGDIQPCHYCGPERTARDKLIAQAHNDIIQQWLSM